MNKHTLAKGFTLIEVLVVLAIIGILSTIIYANFGDARNDAKNKSFQVEMKETQLAIELYKAQYGKYPPAKSLPAFWCAGNIAWSSIPGCNPVIIGLTPDFIDSLPDTKKSANPSCILAYIGSNDGSTYKLIAQNCHSAVASAAEGVQPDDEFAVCPTSCGGSVNKCFNNAGHIPLLGSSNYDPSEEIFYESYAIYSKGAECK